MDRSLDPYFARPTSRLMGFVDGENLVARYQAMLKEGFVPRDDMCHVPDALVWYPAFTQLAGYHEILRVTYYTSVVGDEQRQAGLKQQIRALTFSKHSASMLPNNVTPCVFKRDASTRRSKGVDIQLCVDALTHVHRRNVDAILLLTGDGDYIPLIDEVLRNGIQVFLSAFSSGLNPQLRDRVDALYELDGTTWESRPSTT
jgi:uncharacterized LabA/DUF88 family protein